MAELADLPFEGFAALEEAALAGLLGLAGADLADGLESFFGSFEVLSAPLPPGSKGKRLREDSGAIGRDDHNRQ